MLVEEEGRKNEWKGTGVLLVCMKGSGLIKCVHTRHTAYMGPEEEIKYVGVWYRTC